MNNEKTFIVETEYSIYEYDNDCLNCKDNINLFILLTCLRYVFYNSD